MSNHLVQDKSQRMVVVSADVEALYPSLETIEVANVVFRVKVKCKGIDYMEACKYIAFTSSEQECRIGLLRRVLPVRKHTNGLTGDDPLGPDSAS